MRCNNCGYVNEDNVRFCIMCGQPIDSKGQPEEDTKPPYTEPSPGRVDTPSGYPSAPASTQSSDVRGYQPHAPYSGSAYAGYPVGTPPPQSGYRPPMPAQPQMTPSSPPSSYGRIPTQEQGPTQGGWQMSPPPAKPPRKKKKERLDYWSIDSECIDCINRCFPNLFIASSSGSAT